MRKLNVTLFFIVLIVFGLFSYSYAQTTFDSLVAQWHMDEGSGNTIYDSSGNGYNGVNSGAIWTTGISGSALLFDGQQSHVDIPNVPTSEFTIGAWVKLNQTPSDLSGIVIEKWQTGAGRAWILSVPIIASVPLEPSLDWGTSTMGGVRTQAESSLDLNKWYYLAATVTNNGNDTSTGRIYIDGVLKNSNTWPGTPREADTPVTIGAGDFNDATSPRHYFPGVIDEVSVYNRPLDKRTEYVPFSQSNSQLRTLVNSGPDKPTIVITHGVREDYSTWATDMGYHIDQRLVQEFGGEHQYNIVAWDWETAADMPVWEDLRTVPPRAKEQAGYLYKALKAADLTSNLHFIGYSGGGVVNYFAAQMLRDDPAIEEPGQLTFLDSPIWLFGPKIDLAADWVDNYYASDVSGLFSIGGGLPGDINKVYNQYLGIHTHQYPPVWYDASTTVVDEGLNNEQEGFYWSLALESRRSELGQASKRRTSSEIRVSEPGIVEMVGLPRFKSLPNIFSAGVFLVGEVKFLSSLYWQMYENSPAYLFGEVTLPPESKFLSFDFKFDNLGDGDSLSLSFNDKILFWYEGKAFFGDNFINSDLIDVSSFAGQKGVLTFGLNSVGEKNCILEFGNMKLYAITPEPVSCSLFLLGAGALAGFRKLRRKA